MFLKAPEVDSLEKAADYDVLNASEKLRALNMLCIEVPRTKKQLSLILVNVGKWDTLTLNEKWFVLGAEDKEMLERYISTSYSSEDIDVVRKE